MPVGKEMTDTEKIKKLKQIDEKTALQLAARGKEVLVMAPITTDPEKWIDYEPNTLGHMLEGCLFFRREPEMEVELAGPVETEPAQPDPPAGKKRGPKKALDVGKLVALHNAGWPAAKIADELRVTERTVYAHLQKMREEGESRAENTENAGARTGA